MNSIDELVTRGVSNIIPGRNELAGKLHNNLKLNIYLGIDPTSTKIHLGHAVPLRKLNQFAMRGHNVTFLIGDFTALIGDTSDKDSERPALSIEEIEENFKTYKRQAEKILDFSKVNIRYNSEWLKKLSFEEILRLMQYFSAGDFVGRELIRKRLSQNKRVGLHELLYPVMQGYDSLMLNTDVQIGGTDQTFNMQAGRTLIKYIKKKESFVLTTPILEGTDGRKMSKSWGNAIWLDDNPNDMYAKVLAINDGLIVNYFILATDVPLEKIEITKRNIKKDPLASKRELAFAIVSDLYDVNAATKAQDYFDKVVRSKSTQGVIPVTDIKFAQPFNITQGLLLLQLAKSVSEAKRLILQGGITLNGKVIKDPKARFDPSTGSVLQVGRRKITKLRVL